MIEGRHTIYGSRECFIEGLLLLKKRNLLEFNSSTKKRRDG